MAHAQENPLPDPDHDASYWLHAGDPAAFQAAGCEAVKPRYFNVAADIFKPYACNNVRELKTLLLRLAITPGSGVSYCQHVHLAARNVVAEGLRCFTCPAVMPQLAQVRTVSHEACAPLNPKALDYPHIVLKEEQRKAARALNNLLSILKLPALQLGAEVGAVSMHSLHDGLASVGLLDSCKELTDCLWAPVRPLHLTEKTGPMAFSSARTPLLRQSLRSPACCCPPCSWTTRWTQRRPSRS
jgi:hypothetical protein